jgi:hypothetical protein
MRLRAAVGGWGNQQPRSRVCLRLISSADDQAAPMCILGEPRPGVPATALEPRLSARHPSRWNVRLCADPTNEGRQRER